MTPPTSSLLPTLPRLLWKSSCSPPSAGVRCTGETFRSKVWLPAVEKAGLAPLRFHDLRHSCASFLIAQGAHPKEIQARLGHSSITTTLNVYGHLFPSLDERLAERLDATYRETKAGQERANDDSRVVGLNTAKGEKAL